MILALSRGTLEGDWKDGRMRRKIKKQRKKGREGEGKTKQGMYGYRVRKTRSRGTLEVDWKNGRMRRKIKNRRKKGRMGEGGNETGNARL